MRHFFWYCSLVLVLFSCNNSDEEEAIRQTAQNFGEAFFRLDYDKAYRFCTPESRLWLEAYASALTSTDADSIRRFKYLPEISLSSLSVDDSTAIISCRIEHPVIVDSLGMAAFQSETARTYTLVLIKNSDKDTWKVKMEGPLQSEK